MKIKRIVLIICLVLCLLLVCTSLSYRTTDFSGIMIENGIESSVNIRVKNKQIYKVLNRMSGNVSVQTNDNNTLEYNFSETVFSSDTSAVRFVSVYRFDKNKMENGYFYFDKELKNVILITSERQIYAANDEFCAAVNKMQ